MNRTPRLSPGLLGWLATSTLQLAALSAAAQVPPPPLPPEIDEETTSETPTEPSSSQPPSATEANAGSTAPDSSPDAEEPWERPVESIDLGGEAEQESASVNETADDDAQAMAEARVRTTRRQTTVTGSTGVLRVREAGSGAAGTFRVNLMGSYFSSRQFLCSPSTPCTDPITGEFSSSDRATRTQAIANISATPFPFLEAFASIHNSATSNSEGTPELLQVVGDTNVGVKGFLPEAPDRIYSFGAEADLYLLTGTGGVGLAGSATSVAFRALGTLDLNNRVDADKRIPLRAHVNLGYFVDNSGKIVEDLENTARPDGRGAPIERTERFGLGISRVDSFEIGLATEYVHPYVRPFLEWTLDIAVNRQRYECSVPGALSRGDRCLGARTSDIGSASDKAEARLGTMPSRLSLGARVFPWQSTGLAITAAADIGTGAVNRFLEEVTPEAPYSLWLGLGYTVDTVPPPVKEVQVPSPMIAQYETRRYVLGRVVEEKSGAPIADALIRYQDVPMTGLVANEMGEFITQDLPPGSYTFSIFAEEFKTGECTIVIPESAALLSETAAASGDADSSSDSPNEFPPGDSEAPLEETADGGETGEPGMEAEAAYQDGDGNLLVPATCTLQELPKIANITGLLVDAKTGGPVSDATVTITDKLNRSLELQADEAGAFQFRNVPFGTARVRATAPGYLPTVSPLVIESRKELEPHLPMNPRPKRLALQVTGSEIKLDRQLEFVGETAELTIESLSMLEELAVALMENPELGNVQIQVHTDDSGAASYARRLSQERADAIRNLLIDLGVQRRRLSAKGFGPDQPLVPNVSDANRRRNERVQVILLGDGDVGY